MSYEQTFRDEAIVSYEQTFRDEAISATESAIDLEGKAQATFSGEARQVLLARAHIQALLAVAYSQIGGTR
jgi:hypothetical protein